MRTVSLSALMLAAGLLAGCGPAHPKPPAAPAVAAPSREIVTPAQTADATVIAVNKSGRFVVLNFPSRTPLPPGHCMEIYRNGLKTAEVKVSGPEQDSHTVADILSGEVRRGDEARGE
jgi:hypothetical protein